MQVLFSAALDNVPSVIADCPSQAWLAAANDWAAKQPAAKKKGSAFPAVAMENAILGALADALPLGELSDVPKPLRDFPVSAWATPDGVELAFSTLSRVVCEALAQTDEPVTVAKSVGGWRLPLHVFRFQNQLREVRVTSRTKMPWSDYVVLRAIPRPDRRHASAAVGAPRRDRWPLRRGRRRSRTAHGFSGAERSFIPGLARVPRVAGVGSCGE